MTDAVLVLLIYLIVTVISFWSAHSILSNIETEDKLSIPLSTKIKLAFICSTAYFLPLIFFKSLDNSAFLLYIMTIPLAVIAVQKTPQNPISLKSATSLFFGISARLITAAVILGGASRIILRILKG